MDLTGLLPIITNPILLAAVGSTAMSILIGIRLGRRIGRRATEEEIRRNPTDLERENAEIRQQADAVKYNLDQAQKVGESLRRELESRTKERDKYKAMASTHEVKIPEPKVIAAEKKQVWKERRFANHPSKNLEYLAVELAAFAGLDVEMQVKIVGSGQFSRQGTLLKRAWHHTDHNGKQTPKADLGPWVFHGTAERALDDLRTIITDDHTGLMVRVVEEPPRKKGKSSQEPLVVFVPGDAPEKVWIDPDSPLLFEVDLHVHTPPKVIPPPEVQIVQVPVVETEYVREIIEKPVVISVPAGQEADLCGHTREEVRALIRTELEMEELDRKLSPEKRAEDRARRVAAAKQQSQVG